ncbi:MAG: glycosyltransferase family 4 protein [Clostridia bacterium]|nr:glycosyltransferase family 4 protein [Clostridia bacterium]
MKVLYIDPWCKTGTNLYNYSASLSSELAKSCDVTLLTPFCSERIEVANLKHIHMFFLLSDKMRIGYVRKIIRGIEYLFSYLVILFMAVLSNYDVIHVEWPLVYSCDYFIFSLLKKNCRLFVLKAHNVLPHSTGEKYLEVFRKIYKVPDIILVHGEGIKKSFSKLYPEYASKIRIQRHGYNLNSDIGFDDKLIDLAIKEKVNKYSRVYLFCGFIHYDKGVDRLVEFWVNDLKNKDSLLIVSGAIDENYSNDFESCVVAMNNCENACLISGFADTNLFNFLIYHCDLVLLPYREGSMSGVAFSAAEFSKPILSTNFGSISDYIVDEENSFIVDDFNDFKSVLMNVDCNYTNEELAAMGRELNMYFREKYDWKKIADSLVNDVYVFEIENK